MRQLKISYFRSLVSSWAGYFSATLVNLTCQTLVAIGDMLFRFCINRIETHVTLSYEPTVGNWLTSFTARCDAGSLRGFIIFRFIKKLAPGSHPRANYQLS